MLETKGIAISENEFNLRVTLEISSGDSLPVLAATTKELTC